MKVNMRLLPIKAHFFFFYAAMGPILPQLPLFGKQLGIPPDVMGLIVSILPILTVMAKPVIGLLADYFSEYRKTIFNLIILTMTLSYAGLELLRQPKQHLIDSGKEYNFTIGESGDITQCKNEIISGANLCRSSRKVRCSTPEDKFLELYIYSSAELPPALKNITYKLCNDIENDVKSINLSVITCTVDQNTPPDCLYKSVTFWSFVILMTIGWISCGVACCISDAICFDMLGESEEKKYGTQCMWGSIGYGVSALVSGFFTNVVASDSMKFITPVVIMLVTAIGLDLVCISKLKLRTLPTSDSIGKDVRHLLCQRTIATFYFFATMAGIIESAGTGYMFWYMEEMAAKTGFMSSIKLIEGFAVASACLGEIIFSLISNKILSRLGYVHCLTLCFLMYSMRLALVSIIPNPWWLVATELALNGCSYALCYISVAAYAAAVAPPGTLATMQGALGGMDDGFGCSIGALIGGVVYAFFGGQRSFQIFATVAFITCLAHIFLRPAHKHEPQKRLNECSLPTEQIQTETQALNFQKP